MRFSQRLGLTEVRSALQGRSLDQVTRNRLWSVVARIIPESSGNAPLYKTWMYDFYRHVWSDFFTEPVDEIPSYEGNIRARLKTVFLEAPWYEVYDLLEFSVNSSRNGNAPALAAEIQRVLQDELAGFRLIDGVFVEITAESEISAIEEALHTTSQDEFAPAREHLSAALQLLSDRRTPDYRNSIKESVSAVEATIRILTGDNNVELGKGLKLLEARRPLHGALRSALTALYGYSSDAEGIRHALTEAATVNAADAKFMLVVCSAFVVYLIQKVAESE
jgi:hypothetical protein